MSALSVVIITFNEAANIERCIRSVWPVADEVIVLDSFSTDATVARAEASGAKVYQHVFDGHIQQKNRAITYAQNEFVLSLDADEQLSEELQAAILKAKENFAADGFTMNRLNFFEGRAIKTCGLYPDKKLRLWDITKGSWGGANPHDRLVMQADTRIVHLDGDILHDTYPTADALVATINKFGSIGAKQVQHLPFIQSMVKALLSPPFRFIRNYLFKGGFKEGRIGLFICFQQAREPFLKYTLAIQFKLNS